MDRVVSEHPKKQYSQPKFIQYGDIRELTANVTTTGVKNDGGGTGKTKT
jgi:hypothetical protein